MAADEIDHEAYVEAAKRVLFRTEAVGDCLVCTYRPLSNGVITATVQGRRVTVARIIYIATYGPIDSNVKIVNTCKTGPSCVNMHHLVGTTDGVGAVAKRVTP
jgi:hypothetical protein